MMAPSKCARPDCGKTVYPMEELKCLDQVWHKQCFRCTACNMVLTMKNYKGYEKQPYCEAHYPKTKASVVADTPEMRRLQENTKNQSLSLQCATCGGICFIIKPGSTNACAIMLTLAKSPRSAAAIATALCARVSYFLLADHKNWSPKIMIYKCDLEFHVCGGGGMECELVDLEN
ncbi:putative LIM domain protein [Trichinella nativa]|uniref:Putative LIM domain protein n=1 Tax=Trichinella nativa TaxID=6335 RepID=A0A1Y3EPQ0_9BILA|nr:putative LIM domain protein [Trichinella nativa]